MLDVYKLSIGLVGWAQSGGRNGALSVVETNFFQIYTP